MDTPPHKKLDVSNVALDLVSEIYKITESFPSRQVYGLTSPTRRDAASMSSNIAESARRHTKREFVNCLNMRQGLLSEVDAQSEIARRLGDNNESACQRSMLAWTGFISPGDQDEAGISLPSACCLCRPQCGEWLYQRRPTIGLYLSNRDLDHRFVHPNPWREIPSDMESGG